MKRAIAGAMTVLAAVLLLAFPAQGADLYWDHAPATPASWFDPLNWDLDRLPSGGNWGDNANVSNGGTAQIGAGLIQIRYLRVGGTDLSTVIQTLGSSAQPVYVNVGDTAGTSGVYELQGGELTNGSSGGMSIGSSGTGVFRQSGGTLYRYQLVVGGGGAGTSGLFEMTGGQATLWGSALCYFVEQNGFFKQTGGTFNAGGAYAGPGMIYQGGKWLVDGTGVFNAAYWRSMTDVLGDVEQKGGTVNISSFQLGHSAYINGKWQRSTGTFLLSGGFLQTTTANVGDASGTGIFSQTGGTHTTQTLSLGLYDSYFGGIGTYNFSGGTLNAGAVNVGGSLGSVGTFNQTGGTGNIGFLSVQSNSLDQFFGGACQVNQRLELKGTLDLGNHPVTLTGGSGGWLDFSAGTILGAGSGTLHIQPGAIVTVRSGMDLASIFGTFNNEGILHTIGTTAEIPAGTHIVTQGTIGDPVRCGGSLVKPTAGSTLNLNGGVEAYNGATVDCSQIEGHLQVDGGSSAHADYFYLGDPVSGISNGQISGYDLGFSGSGQFTQSGGDVNVSYLRLSGLYEMSGGTVNLRYDLPVGSGIKQSIFTQRGGVVTVGRRLEVNNYFQSSYRLEAGDLNVNELQGNFNQSGGAVHAQVANTGTHGVFGEKTGGTFDVAQNMMTGGLFHQTAGSTTVGTDLTVTGAGLLSLDGGTFSSATETIQGGSGPTVYCKVRQTGGTNTTNTLTLPAFTSYELIGGALTVNTKLLLQGILDFKGGDGELHVGANGVADMTTGQLLNTANASMFAGAGSHLFFPANFDPYSAFFHFESLGDIHLAGDSYLVGPGESIHLDGDFPNHLLCHGTVSPLLTGFNLNFGVEVFPGGSVETGTGRTVVNNALSAITGGTLRTQFLNVGISTGDGTFTQDGGYVNITDPTSQQGSLTLGYDTGSTGTYILKSGTLTTIGESIGSTGTGHFRQTGGTNNAGSVTLGTYFDNQSTYELSGGILNGSVTVKGLFTQTAGSVSGFSLNVFNFPSTPDHRAAYEMSGNSFLNMTDLSISGFVTNGSDRSSGRFLQDGAATSTSVSRNLSVAYNGLYELRNGTLNASQAVIFQGSFLQSGGASSFQDIDVQNGGILGLSGGSFNVQGLHVETGGRFDLTGGTPSVSSFLKLDGLMDWHSLPANFTNDHIAVDFTGGGSVVNALNGHFELGSDSLTLLPSGFNPAPLFKEYINNGVVHVAGSPFVLPAGKHFSGSADINDLVVCQGGNIHATAGRAMNFNAGLHVESGTVNIGTGTVTMQDFFEMTAGELSGGLIQFGVNGALLLSGGTIRSNMQVASTTPFELRGAGVINSDTVDVRNFMDQTGGQAVLNTLNLDDGRVNHRTWRTYHMTGGTLQVGMLNVGVNDRSGGLWLEGGQTTVTGQLAVGGPYLDKAAKGEAYLEGSAVLTAQTEYVGDWAYGEFNQSGGTNNVLTSLYLGSSNPGGYYALSGGTLNAANEYIGSGNGAPMVSSTFLQTGGKNHITGKLSLGHGAAGATYSLDGGQLDEGALYVGYDKTGTFDHYTGTNTVNGDIYLGYNAGSQGTYHIRGNAQLNANNVYVGFNGAGTFINDGGTYHLTGNMYIGKNGTYTQGTGAINGTLLSVGTSGAASFNLNGGSANFTNFNVGCSSAGAGTVNLAGAAMINANVISVGNAGVGYLYHPSGTVWLTDALNVGVNSLGSYTVGTGLLHSNNITVGQYSTGSLTADDGRIEAGIIGLGSGNNGSGTFIVHHTIVQVVGFYVGQLGQGTLAISDPAASIRISGVFGFGKQSNFTAASGSSIHMTGAAFDNQNTDPSKLADLANLALFYDGHTGETDPFELAGKDLGRNNNGFANNFALGAITLEDKAVLQLVDSFDNLHRGGVAGNAEALYLNALTMLPGSILDLNGKHLYVRDLDYQGGSIINGTLLSLMPGDADNNFCVDGADLAVWQQNYDPTKLRTDTFAMGDWNGDGAVDGADLALWQQNYNPLGGLSNQQTPEPASLLLLGSGLVLVRYARRRRLC